MASDQDYKRFKELTFQGFRELASDESLSRYQKIGFPDSYRSGREPAIFRDIQAKLPNMGLPSQVILDIGPGCTDIPLMMIELCQRQGHQLLLVDSEEMLSLLPDAPNIIKIPGRFPADCDRVIAEFTGRVNCIISYSVLHYIFAESSLFDFVDKSLLLLADAGEMLIGDVPNISLRKRFFASKTGIEFHQQFTGKNEIPPVAFNQVEKGEIDDAVVLSIVARSRAAGYNAFVVPQPSDLPMANRREDILIRKP